MNILAADTETGGPHPSIHALLSIGAECSWTGETYKAYITAESQPTKIIAPAAAQKNGYSPEKWEDRGARPLAVVLLGFLAWIEKQKKARPDAVLLFHHLAFDKSFLSEAARMCGLELPHRNDWVCSQVKFTELMRRGILPAGSSSLNRLNELSGWSATRQEEHDALEDARMARHGYQWLLSQQSGADLKLCQTLGERITALERLMVRAGNYFAGTESGATGVKTDVMDEASRITHGKKEDRTDG